MGLKTIPESKYKYLGVSDDGQWYVFESLPREGFTQERLLEKRARYLLNNGDSKYYDPISLVSPGPKDGGKSGHAL